MSFGVLAGLDFGLKAFPLGFGGFLFFRGAALGFEPDLFFRRLLLLGFYFGLFFSLDLGFGRFGGRLGLSFGFLAGPDFGLKAFPLGFGGGFGGFLLFRGAALGFEPGLFFRRFLIPGVPFGYFLILDLRRRFRFSRLLRLRGYRFPIVAPLPRCRRERYGIHDDVELAIELVDGSREDASRASFERVEHRHRDSRDPDRPGRLQFHFVVAGVVELPGFAGERRFQNVREFDFVGPPVAGVGREFAGLDPRRNGRFRWRGRQRRHSEHPQHDRQTYR